MRLPLNASCKPLLGFAALSFLLALASSGCGGKGGAGFTSSGSQTQFTADLATINTVQTFLSSQTSLDRSDLANAVLAFLKANPKFINPGISVDGTVYATLTDGFPFSIETNDPTIDLQTGPAPQRVAAKAAVQRVTPAVAGGELPGAAEAFVIDALPANCESPAATIASELTAKGYHVTMSSGQLSDWQAISNAAILFNSGHGSQIPDPTTKALVFWQQTGQEPLQSDASWAKPLIASGELMDDLIPVPAVPLSTPGPIKMTWVPRYLISEKYLTNPAMFTANSLFWDECCSGSSNPGRVFVSSLQQHNGLSLFAGWSQTVVITDGNETSSFFFDRALGLNQFAPVDPTHPPPNDWNSINGIMQVTPRTSFPSEVLSVSDGARSESGSHDVVASLAFIGDGTKLTTIIPSIASTLEDTTNNVLTLTGSFGLGQGTVNIGTTALTVKTWTPTTITTPLPTVAGNLQVVSQFKTLSNEVPFESTLVIAITPPGTTLGHNAQKSFSVAATAGVIPTNAQYRWTLTGNGSLSGGNLQITTNSSVVYTAPGSDTSDTLKVEVLNSSGTAAASATALISVGALGIAYTVTGDPSSELNPSLTDGSFNLPFSKSFHEAASTYDFGVIEFSDQLASTMFVGLLVEPGARISTGEVFSYEQSQPGGFYFLPGTLAGNIYFQGTSGSLTITNVKDNGDGTFTIGFNGTATDAAGCQIQANGTFIFHYTYDTGT